MGIRLSGRLRLIPTDTVLPRLTLYAFFIYPAHACANESDLMSIFTRAAVNFHSIEVFERIRQKLLTSNLLYVLLLHTSSHLYNPLCTATFLIGSNITDEK